ncbi:MAG: glycoside hydrolase family 30 protein [Erysipelotrichaceae bacterium]
MKQATLYTTHYANQQKWHAQPCSIETGYSNQMVRLYPSMTYQTHLGFGGAFTEAAAYNFAQLSSANQTQLLNAYFTKEGLHYNLGRTHLNSCDFALGNYACLEDENLDHFSMQRDHQYLIPFMQKAVAMSERSLQIMASPWSPPAFMKTNNEMNHGGELKPEYYGLWAKTIAKYIHELRACTIPITMLSIQNEPMAKQTWDSCLYSPQQEATFIADHMTTALSEQGLDDIKVLVWDHNKDDMFERVVATFENETTKTNAAGVAFHWYGGDHFEALEMIHALYPDKLLLFSEGCIEYSRFLHDPVSNAEMYAHDIIGNLNAGMHGFVDWNLLLDMQGGPNHVGNYCAAPILCDPKEDQLELQLSYYYIGQFSRYIEPNAKRIGLSRYSSDVESCAFENEDGSIAVVMLNRSEKDLDFKVALHEHNVPVHLAAHSIATLKITL